MKNLQQYIDKGYISKRKHPIYDIWILNYTAKCQFDKVWNETTLQCRGLVVDENNKIIARPFKKFFNWEELDNIKLTQPTEIFTKMDGSCIIVFWYNEKWNFATRGSFESDQAKLAEVVWNRNYKHLESQMVKSRTYIFELIGPDNKIVVSYPKNDLVLLGVINTSTGNEFDIYSGVFNGFRLVETHGIADENYYSYLKNLNTSNAEGFVLRDATGFRVKIKFEEYFRLHKLLTGINEKSVWEILSTNSKLDLENVPDEFYEWFTETKDKLEEQFAEIESESRNWLEYIETYAENRKEFALEVQRLCNYPSVVFSMADGKDYSDLIWKILKPKIGDNNE